MPNRTKRQRSGKHVESLEQRRLLSIAAHATSLFEHNSVRLHQSIHIGEKYLGKKSARDDTKVRSIDLKSLDPGATFNVPAGTPLRRLTIHTLGAGATINIEEEGGPVIIKIDSAASDISLISNSSIQMLDCQAWTGGNITAPSVWKLRAGDFSPDLNLATRSGIPFDRAVVLKSAVLGVVQGGQWAVQGDIGEVHVTSAEYPWGVRLQDPSIPLNPLARGEIHNLVDLENISPDSSGQKSTLEAPLFGSIDVREQIEANLISDGPYQKGEEGIGSLHAKWLEDSIVYAHGSIGSLTAGSILDSDVYCGIPATGQLATTVPLLPPTEPPTTFAGFDEPSILSHLSCAQSSNFSFSGSQICAFEIDKANLGSIDSSSPSSVSCFELKNLTFVAGSKQRFHKPKVAATTTIGQFRLILVD